MEPYLGQISIFPYNFAPQNWVPCDGSTLTISANTALFSLLGTMYGGDGIQTFQLPKLTAPSGDEAAEVPLGYYIAVSGVFPSRA